MAGNLLNGRSGRNIRIQKMPLPKINQRPFWLAPANYYVLMAAISIGLFFVVWGYLNSIEEDAAYIPAGITASFLLALAVLFRELVLQRYYQNRFLAQKRLDYNLKNLVHQTQKRTEKNKLSIEKNNTIIKEIETKSKAAQVLGRHSEVHFEIFEMCNAYLEYSLKELETINVVSPRLSSIRKGREKIQKFHKFHLLNWSSIESQNRIKEAKINVAINEKLENAQRALSVLFSALEFYPDEQQLVESTEAVKEFIISIKVSHWVEQAERAAFKENYKRAINHYRDALFFLARENERTHEHEKVAEQINAEIEKLREISRKKLINLE